MANPPFDVTFKRLLALEPAALLRLLGLTGTFQRVVPTEIAAVSLRADWAMLVATPAPLVVHVEVQADRDRTLPRRLLR